MSNDPNRPDRDRYFNDPEYRNRIRKERDMKGNRQVSNSDLRKIPAWFTISFSIFILLILGGIGGYIWYLFQGLPSIDELDNPRTAVASEVVSRDGVVLDRYFVEDRRHVTIDQISPNVINALIATEDHRFYNHWGMDMFRTLAIPFHLLKGDPQGGSTISQQLARNLYRKIGREFSVTRKFREMITAVQLEHNYTKREIIELYLNTVEFSNSAHGIESAARIHFGKSAMDLTVTEAATMVGVLKAVYMYNPRQFPERSQSRRNVVLSLMAKHGFISDEVYQNLRVEEIALNYHPPSRSGRESRYFGEYIRQNVLQWTRDNGYDLYADGLTIHTTIDSRLQRHAEQSLRTNLDEFQPVFEDEWTSPGGEFLDLYWEEFPHVFNDFIRET
ncbi:MAG: transglycosylase domain-containing protein, partial [Balneolaceae bacterium]